MFTGIIEEIGTIEKITKNNENCQVIIKAHKILEDVHVGDSIAVNGICLTVTTFTKNQFSADVMNETWNRTSLANLTRGKKVNLERAMSATSRFGGHIVSGHIDATGTISSIKKDANATWYTIKTNTATLDLIVEKGSITIDGISLTVAKVTKNDFSVSIIPHTLEQTILKYKNVNDLVNLENDLVGKYIQKFLKKDEQQPITKEFLLQNGF